MVKRRIIASSAHMKDPRALVGQPSNNPFVQPDIAQMARTRQSLATFGVAEAVNVPRLNRPSESDYSQVGDLVRPLRIQNIPKTITFSAVNMPINFIRQNLKRLRFVVCNPSSAAFLYVSYGPPVLYNGAIPLGITIKPHEYYEEKGPTVSIDDIYVASDTAPFTIIGFEGILAPEANQE